MANTILLIQWTVASKVRDKAANDRSERLTPLEFKPDLTLRVAPLQTSDMGDIHVFVCHDDLSKLAPMFDKN
jgi:hypothetical protein